jgi:membrane-bound lytic murein transglycosylase D
MTSELPLSRFRRQRLSLLISATLLLNACATLDDGEAALEESNEVRRTAPANAAARRNAPSQVPAIPSLPDITVSESEQLWQQSIWYRLANGMSLYQKHFNEHIQSEINWFANNPGHLLQVSTKASPFIYDIITELEKRGMPLELALLPVLESGYDPGIRSTQNAAGLWQIMAPTATNLGLRRDRWYDGRLDPMASTRAALDYLQRLHQIFDEDWLLALAAYNAGQGNVSRVLAQTNNNNRPVNFWTLPLPRETMRLVPRLLGLAYIMADPENYGVTLEFTAAEPYLTQVDAGSQIDLVFAARLAGIPADSLIGFNTAYVQRATPPAGPHLINLPVAVAAHFQTQLAEAGNLRTSWDSYVIQSGDTLGGIARRFNTSVEAIQDINNLSGTRIRAGDTIRIPGTFREPERNIAAVLEQQPEPRNYTVRRGDTLSAIARTHGVTIADLTRWNGISRNSIIRPGQTLILHLD